MKSAKEKHISAIDLFGPPHEAEASKLSKRLVSLSYGLVCTTLTAKQRAALEGG
jgi:hypothetical protein